MPTTLALFFVFTCLILLSVSLLIFLFKLLTEDRLQNPSPVYLFSENYYRKICQNNDGWQHHFFQIMYIKKLGIGCSNLTGMVTFGSNNTIYGILRFKIKIMFSEGFCGTSLFISGWTGRTNVLHTGLKAVASAYGAPTLPQSHLAPLIT